MKTYSAKQSELEQTCWLIDAKGQTLGRLSTVIANLLRGKLNPQYTPHVNCGAMVIVVNASEIQVTGKKPVQKLYRRHSGYPGGLRTLTFNEMHQKKPEKIIEIAVKGMLPKTSLGHQQLLKLKVFAGPEHTHQAQKPLVYDIQKGGAQ
ncbi:MAG: 50S ribosomal protein L13 [Cyanobacteria bacterium P01_H01_bin.74]